MAAILLLNGPNLNLLGSREPDVYGHTSLEDIQKKLAQLASTAKHELQSFQSNAEHELIERIHQAKKEKIAHIIFNPAAFTHTSIALRDALVAVEIPFIEVHLSNVHAREEFRRQSYFSDISRGVISGFGVLSYELAMTAAIETLKRDKGTSKN